MGAREAPIKAKLWLEEFDTYTFQKKGAETWLDKMRKGMWIDSQQPFVGRSVAWRHKKWLRNRLGGEWPASRFTFASLGKSWCFRRLCRLAPPKFSTKWLKDEPVLRLGGERRGLSTIGIDLAIPLWVCLSHVEQKTVIKMVFTWTFLIVSLTKFSRICRKHNYTWSLWAPDYT